MAYNFWLETTCLPAVPKYTCMLVYGYQYEHGDDQTLAAVTKMMPNKVKRRRKIQTESGVSKQSYEFRADFVSRCQWDLMMTSINIVATRVIP